MSSGSIQLTDAPLPEMGVRGVSTLAERNAPGNDFGDGVLVRVAQTLLVYGRVPGTDHTNPGNWRVVGRYIPDVTDTVTQADIGTPAPTGDSIGYDPATGDFFYVDAAGNWQLTDSGSLAGFGIVGTDAALTNTAVTNGRTIIRSLESNIIWALRPGADPALGASWGKIFDPAWTVRNDVTNADIGTAAGTNERYGYNPGTGEHFYVDVAGNWQIVDTGLQGNVTEGILNAATGARVIPMAGNTLFVSGGGFFTNTGGGISASKYVLQGDLPDAAQNVGEIFTTDGSASGFPAGTLVRKTGPATYVSLEEGEGTSLYTGSGSLSAATFVGLNGNLLTFVDAGYTLSVDNLGFDSTSNDAGNSSSISHGPNGIGLGFAGVSDLEINGDPGTNNQIFASNGPGASPTWKTLTKTTLSIDFAGNTQWNATGTTLVSGNPGNGETSITNANLTSTGDGTAVILVELITDDQSVMDFTASGSLVPAGARIKTVVASSDNLHAAQLRPRRINDNTFGLDLQGTTVDETVFVQLFIEGYPTFQEYTIA